MTDELGESQARTLVAQLTGRSANLFLLDTVSRITHAFRAPRGEGQLTGDIYRAPVRQSKAIAEEHEIPRGAFATISAAADEHYRQIEADHQFNSLATDLQVALAKRNQQATKTKS